MKKLKGPLPLYPILIAIYPVLALLAHNIEETPLSSGYRALILSAIGGLLLLVLFRLILKDWHKVGLVSSLALLIFFVYGHLHNFVPLNFTILGRGIRNHSNLAPLSLGLFALGFWLVWRKIKDAARPTNTLNILGVLILILPLYQIASHQVRLAASERERAAFKENSAPQLAAAGSYQPNIYVFVLDKYPRADQLQEDLGFDNSGFLRQLEDMGFFVAECSQSNYQRTNISLAALLNLNYIEELVPSIEAVYENEDVLNIQIRDSLVRQELEKLGYVVAAFESGFRYMTMDHIDYFFTPENDRLDVFEDQLSASWAGRFLANYAPNDFEWLLVETSAADLLIDLLAATMLTDETSLDEENIKVLNFYRRNLFVFEQLESIPTEIESPKFVFAHIISPHPPYVFNRDGSLITPGTEEAEAFTNQITYLNSRLITIFEEILDESSKPPIILVMGDHGADSPFEGGDQSTDILNAYYLPGEGKELLYGNISPVNSFRLIFSQYFGGEYELLEDVSYYSDYLETPYDFYPVPNARSSCEARYP